MPTKYKLTYLDLQGRAELIRMVFALADVEYEDIRVTQEQMQELKPSLPLGQVPVLEFDGQKYCQSHAIARYLAEQFGFAGKTPLEKLKIDMVIDSMNDFIQPLIDILHSSDDENKKEKMRKKFLAEQAHPMLTNLERLVEPSGFMVGDTMTYADLAVLVYSEWPHGSMVALPGQLDYTKYPKLKAVIDKVSANPNIAAWLKKRPDSVL